jgi:hypothetical protein
MDDGTDRKEKTALIFAERYIDAGIRGFAEKLSKSGWNIWVRGEAAYRMLAGMKKGSRGFEPETCDLYCIGLVNASDIAAGLAGKYGFGPTIDHGVDVGCAILVDALCAKGIIVTDAGQYGEVLAWLKEGRPDEDGFKAILASVAASRLSEHFGVLSAQFGAVPDDLVFAANARR